MTVSSSTPARLLAGSLVGIVALAVGSCGGSTASPPQGRATGASTAAVPGQVPATVTGLGTLPAPASAWPEASYDARRSSATTATGPTSAKTRWTRDLGAKLIAGPVIGADGSVIETPANGVVHALDPADGHDRWTLDIGQPGGSDLSSSPAVLAGGLILVPGVSGDLVAISRSGKLLWEQPVGDGQVLSPAIAGDGRVDVVDMDGTVMALTPDAKGAHPQWMLKLGGSSYGSPAVAPDGTILTTSGEALIAIRDNGSSATVRWRFAATGDVEVSPAVTAAGVTVLGTNAGAEYGVRSDGTRAWSYPKKQWSYSSPVAARGGAVSFGDNDGRVYTVDGTTGSGKVVVGAADPKSARSSVGVGVWTAPVSDAAGDLYVGTASGRVEGYRSDGTRLFDLDTGSTVDSYPALGGDGTLYVGSNSGTLYAIGS